MAEKKNKTQSRTDDGRMAEADVIKKGQETSKTKLKVTETIQAQARLVAL